MATTEVGIGSSEAGHRKSIYPDEYVRILHVQPSGTEPITRYDLDTDQPGHFPGDAVPILTNPNTGLQETPDSSYVLSTLASSSNPFEETERLYTNGISTQHLWASARGATVTRWRSVYGSPYNLDLEWMCRTGPSGLGQGLGGSERWFEYDQTASENMHNPTHGGSRNLPVEANPYADEVDAPTSPAIDFNATLSYVEGAVVPLQWDGDGTVEPFSEPGRGNSHGAVADTSTVIWWRQKHYQRIEPHHEGSLFVHRVRYHYYNPIAILSTDFGGSSGPPFGTPGALKLTAQYTCSISLINDGPVQVDGSWDQFWYADIAGSEPALTQYASWDTGSASGELQFRIDGTRYLRDFAAADGPTLFPGGYALIVAQRSGDGFCVALMAKLNPNVSNIGLLGKETNINFLGAQHFFTPTQYAGAPDYANAAEAILIAGCDSYAGRSAGWVGMNVLLYSGPFSEVLGTAIAAYDSGWLDELPDFSVMPSIVRAGTEIADPPSPGGGGVVIGGSGQIPTTGFPPTPGSGGGATSQGVQGVIGTGRYAGNYLKYASRLK